MLKRIVRLEIHSRESYLKVERRIMTFKLRHNFECESFHYLNIQKTLIDMSENHMKLQVITTRCSDFNK